MIELFNLKQPICSLRQLCKATVIANMREKQSGAVYWLEIAAGILLVVLIILLIKGQNWQSWITSISDDINNMIGQVAGYWENAT